jgi:transposase
MYYVGIDWADQKYDIVILDDQGHRALKYFTIPKSHDGFYNFLDRLRKLSLEPRQIIFGIETANNILVDFLFDLGYQIFWIQPGKMDSYRKRYRLSGARDDEFDAFVIANVLRTDRDYIRNIDFGSKIVREIRILVRDHHQLIEEQTALKNSFRATVKEYYPECVHFFKNIACPSSLAFLKAYPTFMDAKGLNKNQLTSFFKELGLVNYNAKVTKIYNITQQYYLTAAPVVIETKKFKALRLIEKLTTINNDIALYREKIKETLYQHPDHEFFLSYPGVADILAARLIAMFGDNRDLFQTANEIQTLAGCCPVTEKTGKNTKIIYFRRSCNKFHRDTSHNLAFSSLTKSNWALNYYKKHRNDGKTNAHALRCLANHHIKILFAMWKNKSKYDENIFLAQKLRNIIANEKN